MFGKKKVKEKSIEKKELTPEQLLLKQKYEEKDAKKKAKMAVWKEKLEMYDMIIANLIAGNSIIEPSMKLKNSQIAIGFSNISSETQLTKYYLVKGLPDWLRPQFIDEIRKKCMRNGLKIDFYINIEPHKINWDTPEMKNRMKVWSTYAKEHSGGIDVFDYSRKYSEKQARMRMINSTKYLNEAERVHKRAFVKVSITIAVSAKRDMESLTNMADSIAVMKSICNQSDIKLAELRINLLDWIRAISPFSMDVIADLKGKIMKRVMTDDLLANFNSYKQGRVGTKGIALAIDVLSNTPIMRQFKEDPDGAENWLISAGTGSGKSYLVKTWLSELSADGFVCCIMDYEGDEYLNLANFIKAGNPEDVKIVSMGKGSTIYFDPCEIPELTGDSKVDDELKESAINFILAIFRVMIHGLKGGFTKEEERVMSMAIQRMYDSAGVTDNKDTWYRSAGLRLHDVYSEILNIVESKELVDADTGNLKHMAATAIVDATSIYFEEGESKSGTFKNPMSANELYRAKFIVFSFGMKGADMSSADPVILALKQLSVAYVNIQISNYCKYVRKCFNVKVWEEMQRWSSGENYDSSTSTGSMTDALVNVITGGRKRGDVNFIITNDLGSLLDESNALGKKLRSNIQNYAIGKIKDSTVRRDFCRTFDQQEMLYALDTIAKANSEEVSGADKIYGSQSRYKHAFCIMMDDGKRAIGKVKLPAALVKSNLFKTGVDRTEEKV